MSVTAVKDAYQSAYFQFKLEGDKVPPARAIQNFCAGVEGDAGMVKARVAVH